MPGLWVDFALKIALLVALQRKRVFKRPPDRDWVVCAVDIPPYWAIYRENDPLIGPPTHPPRPTEFRFGEKHSELHPNLTMGYSLFHHGAVFGSFSR